MSFLDMIADGATTVEHALGGGHEQPATTPTAPGQAAPPSPGALGDLGQSIGDMGHALAQEGLGALLDPQGAADRQRAQRELAGNFQVVPDDFVGPRLPNQVSQHEYENIAHEYSDIRLDRTDLHMDTSSLNAADAAQYRRDAMAQMGRMMETGSGRGLIDGLAHNAHNQSVTLSPFRDAAGAIDPTNAQSQPDSNPGAVNPATGSAVHLNINPGVDDYSLGRNTDAWNHTRGDVVMAHEMTHALHQVRGDEDQSGPVQPGEQGLNGSNRDANAGNIQRWEHQAVGLGNHGNDTTPNENAYRAERAMIGTAGGAGAVHTLPGDIANMFGVNWGTNDANMAQRGAYGR